MVTAGFEILQIDYQCVCKLPRTRMAVVSNSRVPASVLLDESFCSHIFMTKKARKVFI